MKIGIDATPLCMAASGISNYLKYLLAGMAVVGNEHSFVLYTNKPCNLDTTLPKHCDLKIVRLPFPRMQAWYQFGLPARLPRDGVDVFMGVFHRLPLLASVPTVLTIHDLSGVLMKRHHTGSVVLRDSLMPAYTKKARRIIAVSQFTAEEILRHYPSVRSKLDVVPEAPAPGLKRVNDEKHLKEVRVSLNLPDRYILFLGTLEPRKNLPAFLRAYESVSRQIPQHLVLTGRMGWKTGRLQDVLDNLETPGKIHLTGHVDEKQLPALLSMADLVAYPSLYEGFGLPVVEAMACGTPVLTSSVSSLPETAGGAALLADPLSVEDMARKLLTLATDSTMRKKLSLLGLERISELSWERTARETLQSCRKALEPE